MKFSFIKSGKKFYIFTLVVIVAAIACFIFRGFNMDIEFVGGTELSFKLDKGVKPDEAKISQTVKNVIGEDLSGVRIVNGNEFIVRTTLVDEGVDYKTINNDVDAVVKGLFENATIVNEKTGNGTVAYVIPKPETEPVAEGEEAEEFDPVTVINEKFAELDDRAFISIGASAGEGENEYVISYLANSEVNKLREQIEDAVNELYPFPEGQEGTRLSNATSIGPDVSDELKRSAIIATVVAVVLMLAYIAIRFEGRAAVAAVLCLVHDMFIVLFAYSVFQIPVSSTIIAVILTILGYSINATIVIFDRVRENNKAMSDRVSFEDKADSAVKSTLWRSLNTTITTLVTIGLIYVLGVTSIKNFALPLIVGIVAGVYSSVCLSANLWVSLKKLGKKNAK